MAIFLPILQPITPAQMPSHRNLALAVVGLLAVYSKSLL